MAPWFDRPVPPGGYSWWYVDALSDDARHGLTLIAFVGSVFSPYYAWARRAGAVDPQNHCAVNVALYGAGGKRWAMTERSRAALRRDGTRLAIGPTCLAWDGRALTIEIDEVSVPWPGRLRGSVRVVPDALTPQGYALDAAGEHRWWPLAPSAAIEVEMRSPRLRWSGRAYLDTNGGDVPLEEGFHGWDWSRAELPGRGTAILYDVRRRDGSSLGLALRIGRDGSVEHIASPPPARLARTLWRIERRTRSDPSTRAHVIETLEDTPFYARSLLAAGLAGERVTAVHESLSLDRFRAGWVQGLLPFRMPRRRGPAPR